jgi:hypothetical protein
LSSILGLVPQFLLADLSAVLGLYILPVVCSLFHRVAWVKNVDKLNCPRRTDEHKNVTQRMRRKRPAPVAAHANSRTRCTVVPSIVQCSAHYQLAMFGAMRACNTSFAWLCRLLFSKSLSASRADRDGLIASVDSPPIRCCYICWKPTHISLDLSLISDEKRLATGKRREVALAVRCRRAQFRPNPGRLTGLAMTVNNISVDLSGP